MRNYLDLMEKILLKGDKRPDRTGTGTYSLFNEQLKFDLTEGFPAVTTKKLFFRGVVEELLWMISGSTNVKPLQDKGVNIWNEWADKDGELGPVYGKQWRDWNGIDQYNELKNGLMKNPYGRRHILSAWNVPELDKMALPPCHVMSQFYVSSDDRLSCHMYQRSCDYFLGAPFNIAQYALLTHLLAKETGLTVGELGISYGDVHIYQNHVEQCMEQIRRKPYSKTYLSYDESGYPLLKAYRSHPALKAEISV